MKSANDAPDRPMASKPAVIALGVVIIVVLGVVLDMVIIVVNEMKSSMRIIRLGCFFPRVNTHALFALFGVHEMPP